MQSESGTLRYRIKHSEHEPAALLSVKTYGFTFVAWKGKKPLASRINECF
jgi:hypothetical protein